MIIPITFNLLSVTARYPVAITHAPKFANEAERVAAWHAAHKEHRKAYMKGWRERKASNV